MPHSDGLPCDNVNGATGVMEVEPAVEISATGARETYQCPGLIATQPIPLTTPITDLWTDRSSAATPTEPAAARPKRRQKLYTGLCIAAEGEGSARTHRSP